MPTTTRSVPSKRRGGTVLGNLPLELVLEITDHLPPSSIACLALTCKDLYASPPLKKTWTKGLDPVAFPSKCYHKDYPCYPDDTTRSHERFQLMRRLKKDIPSHLFCDYCHKFHPKPKVDRTQRWLTCPSSNKATWISWPKFDFRLQFEDILGVVNHLRLGRLHGAPMSSIAKATDWNITTNVAKTWILCKLNVEPEVINDNLVLHTTQRTFFTERQLREGPRCYLDPLIDSMGVFKICQHQESNYRMQEKLRRIIDTLLQHPNVHLDDRANGWAKSLLASCDVCTTHFCIEIAHHRGVDVAAEGLEISLHTWMNLGRCGHTFSPCWLDISERREIHYPSITIEEAKRISLDVFKKDVSSTVSTQYTRIRPSKTTTQHPSLLPAIDRAVLAEKSAYLSKYNEITKILKEAKVDIRDIPMEIVAECEIGYRPRRVLETQEEIAALMRARSIIQDHRRRVLASRSWWDRIKTRFHRVFEGGQSSREDILLLLV